MSSICTTTLASDFFTGEKLFSRGARLVALAGRWNILHRSWSADDSSYLDDNRREQARIE